MNITDGFCTYIEAFRKSAASYAENTAVLDEKGSFTYRELNEISDMVAMKILDMGVSMGDRVLIYLPRQKEIAAAAIGTWKAGCVYIPVDHTYPYERIRYMMENASAVCICTIRALWEEKPLGISEDSVLFIDEISEKDDVNKTMEFPSVTPEDDAMVIYTSGSTGKPKGVLHTHRSLFALANWQPDTEIKTTEASRYSNVSSFSFIASITDIYSALLCGGSTYIISENVRQDPKCLYDTLCNHGITHINATVRLFVILIENYDMRRFMVRMGGERVTEFCPLYPTTITELYGSSEGCFTVYGEITGSENPMPLGKPNACIEHMLIDDDGNAVEVGETGEFVYTGPIQAKEYLNLPELSEERWVEKDGKRWFFTGDLMKENEEGTLFFVQRKDFMVKINGFRIELGEIENTALKCPGVAEAVCVSRYINGGNQLCCFIAGEGISDRNTEEIRKYMASALPSYMMPSFIVCLDKLPRNANGKIDRNALPEIDINRFIINTYAPPENELQQEICEAFAKTLGMNAAEIGIDVSFFDIGGNSILVMKLVTSLAVHKLTAMDIFKAKTVRAIADIVNERKKQSSVDADAAEQKAREESYPLTSFQKKIMVDQLGDIHSTVWNIPALFRLGEKIDAQRLCEAINRVIQRHPSLLTVMEKRHDGEMYQHLAADKFVPIQIEEMPEDVFNQIKDDLVLPFTVLGELHYRIRLIKTEKNLYLFTDVHHLRLDGTSLGILYKEIVQTYKGTYSDTKDYYYSFLLEEKNNKNKEEYKKAQRYFEDRYGKIEKWTRVPERDFNDESYGIDVTGILPCGLTVSDLEKAEKRYRTSRNILAVAAGLIALSEQTGKNNVMVSWIFDNRSNDLYKYTVGSLNKEFPVGLSMNEIKDIERLIEEINRQVIDGISNSTYEYVTEKYIRFTTDTIFINYLGNLRNHSVLDGLDADQISVERKHDISKVSLGLAVFELEDGTVLIGVEYCNGLYRRETAMKYHELYQTAFVNLIKGSAEEN